MTKISVNDTRKINGGAKYTATRRCENCGKRFSASVFYFGWSAASKASARTSALLSVNNQYNNHVLRHF